MLLSFVARKVGRKLMSKRAMTFAQRKALQKAQKASALARKSLKYGKKVNKSFDKTKAHNLKALKQLKGMAKKKGTKPSWLKEDIAAVTKGIESNKVRHGYVKNLVKSVRRDVKAKSAIQKNMEKTLTKKYGTGMVKSASRTTLAQKASATAKTAVIGVVGASAGLKANAVYKSQTSGQSQAARTAQKQAQSAMNSSSGLKKAKKQ
jgi:DNA polymerase II small subunit/DNA polymerase delta subunit B